MKFLALVLLFATTSAHAWDAVSASIEAGRRETQAHLTDWADDYARTIGPKRVACGITVVQDFTKPLPVVVLEQLPRIFGMPAQADNTVDPAAPVQSPLAELAKRVTLLQTELDRLKNLQERPVQDASDRLRLFIDTEIFLIQVSTRLYQVEIDYHFARTEGLAGFFRYEREYCAAYTLRTQRDLELAKAGRRILKYYDFLEQELAD
jgi:hypothetical protein